MIPALLIPLAILVGVFALGAFFWFWWAGPQAQVPPYLDKEELKRRELQDRLRQTNFQVLTAAGLVSTFVLAWVQLGMTSRQWSSDFDLRLRHEQAQGFAEAAKDLVTALVRGPAFADQAAQRLYSYAVNNPADFSLQANSILASVVRDDTERNDLGESEECKINSSNPNEPFSKWHDREEAPPSAQAAITQLGRPKFAALRHVYAGRTCVDPPDGGGVPLNFDHGRFDNFNLRKLDLSCSYMPQVRLRRANLNGARLFGADMRGAHLADWEIPNSPAATGLLDGKPFTKDDIGFEDKYSASAQHKSVGSDNTNKKLPRLERWQTYRCFIADLRNADLRGADLENAALGGADLSGADLTGANLCGANISRANFTGAKGLTTPMMMKTCVGRYDAGKKGDAVTDAQPIGLDKIFAKEFKVCACGDPSDSCRKIPCESQPMDHPAAYALINRPRWWPKWPKE